MVNNNQYSFNIKDFILEHVDAHPHDIVNLAMRAFGISRPAVHKHLKVLVTEGKLAATGKTKARTYRLIKKDRIAFEVPIVPGLSESDLWREKMQPFFIALPANVATICEYGFTEMVNNVIDHSQGTLLKVVCMLEGSKLQIIISDNGIGIFKKVAEAFHLSHYREAIFHLSKGKVTTDPAHHTGEGIFFTSRSLDQFLLKANGLCYIRWSDDDWLLDKAQTTAGTEVQMILDRQTSRALVDVFNAYAHPDNDYSFSKTNVIVKLGLIPGETYISRSQAKRILWGLEKFKHVVLDFKRVSTVGQGFVDEVFRVFKRYHPDIEITYTNASANVEFMIKRSLPMV